MLFISNKMIKVIVFSARERERERERERKRVQMVYIHKWYTQTYQEKLSPSILYHKSETHIEILHI